MHEPFDMTIVIFALLAVFVLWKLRSVLGTRSGTEKPPTNPFASLREGLRRQPAGAENKVFRLPGRDDLKIAPEAVQPDQTERWKGFAEPGSKVWAGLDAIVGADPSFEAGRFLDGAKAAYEMIVTAFAAGNREVLANLLDRSVFDSFAAAISEHERRGEKVETTFVSIDKAAIEDAELIAGSAQIKVRFASNRITATRDRKGVVVEGSPDRVAEVNDVWTFRRDPRSTDPNWKLVATEAGH